LSHLAYGERLQALLRLLEQRLQKFEKLNYSIARQSVRSLSWQQQLASRLLRLRLQSSRKKTQQSVLLCCGVAIARLGANDRVDVAR
jgi:hypothetical protein